MYGPNLSPVSSVSVRRLAWALGINMGAAISRMVQEMPKHFNPAAVCPKCKDNTKCASCIFSNSKEPTK
jgi:hypothetical protein